MGGLLLAPQTWVGLFGEDMGAIAELTPDVASTPGTRPKRESPKLVTLGGLAVAGIWEGATGGVRLSELGWGDRLFPGAPGIEPGLGVVLGCDFGWIWVLLITAGGGFNCAKMSEVSISAAILLASSSSVAVELESAFSAFSSMLMAKNCCGFCQNSQIQRVSRIKNAKEPQTMGCLKGRSLALILRMLVGS